MRVLTPTHQATLYAVVQSYINLFESNVFGTFFFQIPTNYYNLPSLSQAYTP